MMKALYYNPCTDTEPKRDIPAAKVWELLRRNEKFRIKVKETESYIPSNSDAKMGLLSSI